VSPAIKYTLARVGLFVVIVAVLYPLGLDLFLTMMIALLISLPLSYFLLRRWRDQMAQRLETTVEQHRAQKEKLRAALSGEDSDDEPEPAVRPTRR
jgi:ABC-type bacteriocin/lantibiotic exporter with double-glycine peptidase domain